MRAALVAVWAVILTTGIVQAANGLQTDLLGVRAGLDEFSPFAISIVMAGYYVGYSAGPLLCPLFIRRFGHVATIVVGLLIAASVITLHGVFVSPAAWTALRAVAGVALACVYISFESWINARTGNVVRGRVFGIYMVAQMVGMTGSQFLLMTASPATMVLFLLSGSLFLLGAVPVFAARSRAPVHADIERVSLGRMMRVMRELFVLSPLGLIETFLSGISWSMVFTFAPVYAQHVGLSVNQVAWFMGVAMASAAVLQFPLGWISDHVGRRLTLALMCLGGTASALFGIWADAHGLASKYIASALIGALVFPLYSLAVAHTNDKIAPQLRVPAAAALVLLFGLGSILGPLTVGQAMTWLGPGGYYDVLAGVMGVSLAVAAATR
ncbi:MAG TPA: MFS transporter [Rhizomicrobium sp.]|jgi:MFS family permease